MENLIGKAEILYEICYISLLFIALAVVNSATYNMVIDLIGTFWWIGIILLSIAVITLVLKVTEAIEKVLSLLELCSLCRPHSISCHLLYKIW